MISRRRLLCCSALFGLIVLGLLPLGGLKSNPNELEAADTAPTAAAVEGTLSPDWVKTLHWRCIGPANMSGRITALSVYEADPTTYWVATASGGLLKTINNGITFEHQFDRESTVSIGDVCVAPSDRNIVWVGTGENNPRNSVSYGDGVYKSVDSGKSWKNMGLKKTFQIGKIIVHPTNPNIVYVGALGRLYGPNEDRGLFKTSNGGATWDRILYVDDKTGVLDMRMHPTDPETLLVATWERQRDQFDGFFGDFEGDQYGPIKVHAPGTALYRTSDGGKTFNKLTQGLPTVKMGRIGLDWYRKDPNVVFAIIDTERVGTSNAAYLGVVAENAKPEGVKLTQVADNSPAAKAGLKVGDIVTALDSKALKGGNQDFLARLRAKKVGDKVSFSVQRGSEPKEIAVTLTTRPAEAGGGRGTMLLAGFVGEDIEDGIRVSRLLGEDAQKAGLKEGDLVTAIDGKPAGTFREAFAALSTSHKAGDKIKVTVNRAGEKKDIELVLAPSQFGRGGGPGGGGRGQAARRPFGSGLGGQRENVQDQQGPDGFQTGGLFKSSDGGQTWTRINSINPRPMYFSQVRVDPTDDRNLYVLGVSIDRSSDGGKSFRTAGGRGVHADGHALWIDPKDGRHMLIGCDGGYYVTYDRMANWDHLNQSAIGQFYHAAVDPRPLYRVYGGLQDNGSWGGPSRTLNGTGPLNEDWISVGGGDGFTCRVDPNDPDLIYSTSQNGAMSRRNLRTGEVASIRPGGGGGRGGAGGPGAQGPRYRFNWNSPFILSNRNSRIFYCAGNVVFRSLDRGSDLVPISPEITRTNKGSATALAESPRNPSVLYAGTDDGALWVTKNGGQVWTDIAKNVNLPGPRWVATIEPSRSVEGRAYVVFDGHRSDDDEPYVYVTEDFGQTWKSLRANLPWGSTRCLREDLTNPNLLYLGTEFGVWVSLNRGESWTKVNNNLPTVAVHEFALHPTSGEMVAATHGRSLWILDVAPLRQMTTEVLKAPAYLFKPTVAVRWHSEPRRGGTSRRFVGENPPAGAQFYYALAKKPEKVSLKVLDVEGKLVRELRASSEPGLHRVAWDLSRAATRPGGRGGQPGPGPGQPPGESGEEPQPRRGPGGGGFGGQAVAPGQYRVVLTVDGKEFTQSVRVEADPSAPRGVLAAEEEEGDGD